MPESSVNDDLHALLQSVSDVLFPAEDGDAVVQLDSRSAEGDTPLHVFAWRRDVKAAERLVQAGADVNAVGDMGETPLHIAIRGNNLELVLVLVNAGADVTVRSEFGETPHEAAQRTGGTVAEAMANRRSRRALKGDA